MAKGENLDREDFGKFENGSEGGLDNKKGAHRFRFPLNRYMPLSTGVAVRRNILFPAR
jgi:hypothetical protein